MNISGHQYSKSVSGMRDPTKIENQPFKMIFIYPILVDKTLSAYKEDIRSFISIGILKELFVSNSINMINMASQVHPLIDEKGKSFDTTKITGNIELLKNQWGSYDRYTDASIQTRSQTSEINKSELKQQIKKRVAVIKKLLSSDKEYSQYKPYIELITMDNFIDVPVIVGTKAFDIDTLTTTFVLLAAIASNGKYSLSVEEDVNLIFNEINKLKDKDASKLLQNVLKLPEREKSKIEIYIRQIVDIKLKDVKRWYGDKKEWAKRKIKSAPVIGSVYKGIESAKNRYDVITKKQELPQDVNEPGYIDIYNTESFDPDDSMNILRFVKSKTKETELFFKFCLNSKLAGRMFGTDLGKGQIATVFSEKDEDINNIMNNLLIRFMKAITEYCFPLINSLLYLFYPRGININESGMIDSLILTPIYNKLEKYIVSNSTLKDEIIKSMTDVKQSDSNLKELGGMCNGEFRNIDRVASKFAGILSDNKNTIKNLSPNIDNYNTFMYVLSDTVRQTYTYTSQCEFALSKITNLEIHKNTIKNIIVTSLMSFINELYKLSGENFNIIPITDLVVGMEIDQNTYNNIDPDDHDKIIIDNSSGTPKYYFKAIDDLKKFTSVRDEIVALISDYIYFMFMYSLQASLCELVTTLSVSVDTAKNSVLTFPNYLLVIPLESIIAVANAFSAKGWKGMVSGSSLGFVRDLSENYVKGVLKFLTTKLRVPNIIIIDKNKDEMYYKLMYQSTIQKIKLSSLQSYIENSKNITIDDSSSNNSYF